MAATAKLTYFDIEGLGEPIRWLLSYKNVDFEDHRVSKESWPTIKPTTPFGQMPLLEIDGKTLWQHSAICRYLAREMNLVGKTSLDGIKADIIVDTITDFRVPLASHHYDPNPESKASKLGPLQKETVPYFLSRFEKIVTENDGYFVSGQLTWADIYFVAISDYLQLMAGGMDFFKDYPNLAQLKAKVLAFPQIQAWVAKRPPVS